jgi:hypothetical protein
MEPPFAQGELSRSAPPWSYSYSAFLETLAEGLFRGDSHGDGMGTELTPHDPL